MLQPDGSKTKHYNIVKKAPKQLLFKLEIKYANILKRHDDEDMINKMDLPHRTSKNVVRFQQRSGKYAVLKVDWASALQRTKGYNLRRSYR